ncbi:MAG: hypothetical protein WD402_01940 [Chloroflexota bacterium]
MKRRRLAALAAAVTAALVPAVASAALLWTLVASPLTTTANVSTTFTLTATNLDALTELGCLEVDLPASFVIESLGTPTASNGDEWESSTSGNAVIVQSLSGGGRLELTEWVRFTIRAHATVAGDFLWPNHAHQHQDCRNPEEIGVPLTVTVLPALSPTATPAPTATPSLSNTASPTPILPLPSISLPGLPSLLPSASPTASPIPGEASPSTPTPQPSASATEIAGGGPGSTTDSGDGGSGAGSPGGQTLTLGRLPDSLGADADVGLELLGLLDADYVWFVPAASVALPGLLVILWVVLQAIGALAWIPAVRRMADEKGTPARRPGAARA